MEDKAVTALLDGDVLVYRVGYSTMDAPVGIAVARLNSAIEAILEDSGSEAGFKVFLTPTDKSNFRYKIYPEYKAQRPDKKPVWYKELRETLLVDYETELAHGMEADDLLGIYQTKDTIICTIDKDLDQIAGWHYDFVKETKYFIDPATALRFFYFQLLTGDTVDNVPGCVKIGPKKATVILEGLKTEEEYEKAVFKAYEEAYKGLAYAKMLLYGRVLKIKQHKDEGLWQPKFVGKVEGHATNKASTTS